MNVEQERYLYCSYYYNSFILLFLFPQCILLNIPLSFTFQFIREEHFSVFSERSLQVFTQSWCCSYTIQKLMSSALSSQGFCEASVFVICITIAQLCTTGFVGNSIDTVCQQRRKEISYQTLQDSKVILSKIKTETNQFSLSYPHSLNLILTSTRM